MDANTLYIHSKLAGLRVRLIYLLASSNTSSYYHSSGNYDHTILAVIGGKVNVIYDNYSYTAIRSQFHYLPGDCLISMDAEGSGRFWLICFTEQFASTTVYSVISDVFDDLTDNKHFSVITDERTFKTIKKLILLLDKHHQNYGSNNSLAICELTFNLLFSCLSEVKYVPSPAAANKLRRKEIVAMNFFELVEQNVNLHHDVRFYAEKMCMAQGNLTKIVKSISGRPPKGIIEEMLVKVAKELLDTTLLTIYIIAEESGFKSSSAFINFFKSQTGLTPQQYRNRKSEQK